MTSEERERMNELFTQIAVEKDPATFDRLVAELNDLFEVKHQRISPGALAKKAHFGGP